MRSVKALFLAAAISTVLSATLAPPAEAKSYANFHNVNCPMWRTDEPIAAFGVIGGNAQALCVRAYGGHVWGGGAFAEQRPPMYAALSLDRYYSGAWHVMEADAYRVDSSCFTYRGDPLPYNLWILHVEWVQVCHMARDLHVQTGQRPPRGCYRTRLQVRTENEHLLDVKSDQRCF
jgi:hypothetical protein